MRSYINIFLTLVMPISILFTAAATVYFITSFEFSKALRLGIIAGVLIGIGVSLVLALILLIVRVMRQYKIRTEIFSPTAKPSPQVILDPTIYEKKHQSIQENLKHENKFLTDAIEEKFMLLMDKELAYEISLASINQQKIGAIIHQNKEEGSILLRSKEEEIKISISSLTKHTAEVLISSTIDNNNIKNIIALLKEKEHSFMQY